MKRQTNRFRKQAPKVMKSSTVTARVTHEEHRKIREYCSQFSIPMQDMLRDMIMYVIDNVPLRKEEVVVFDLGDRTVRSSKNSRPLRGITPECEVDDDEG